MHLQSFASRDFWRNKNRIGLKKNFTRANILQRSHSWHYSAHVFNFILPRKSIINKRKGRITVYIKQTYALLYQSFHEPREGKNKEPQRAWRGWTISSRVSIQLKCHLWWNFKTETDLCWLPSNSALHLFHFHDLGNVMNWQLKVLGSSIKIHSTILFLILCLSCVSALMFHGEISSVNPHKATVYKHFKAWKRQQIIMDTNQKLVRGTQQKSYFFFIDKSWNSPSRAMAILRSKLFVKAKLIARISSITLLCKI